MVEEKTVVAVPTGLPEDSKYSGLGENMSHNAPIFGADIQNECPTTEAQKSSARPAPRCASPALEVTK